MKYVRCTNEVAKLLSKDWSPPVRVRIAHESYGVLVLQLEEVAMTDKVPQPSEWEGVEDVLAWADAAAQAGTLFIAQDLHRVLDRYRPRRDAAVTAGGVGAGAGVQKGA